MDGGGGWSANLNNDIIMYHNNYNNYTMSTNKLCCTFMLYTLLVLYFVSCVDLIISVLHRPNHLCTAQA